MAERLTGASSLNEWRAEKERVDGPASWPLGARVAHRDGDGVTGVVVANDATHVTIDADGAEWGPFRSVLMHRNAALEWWLA